MVYCGVIGHVERMDYTILGPPIEKATAIMSISGDKVTCSLFVNLYEYF